MLNQPTPGASYSQFDLLPPVGTAQPADWPIFVRVRNDLATMSRTERDKWMPIRDSCLNLFNFGEDPKPPDGKFIINHIQNDVIGDKDVMFHEPMAVEVGIEDDGSGVLAYYWNGPAQIPVQQPVTDEMGQPMSDAMGQPAIQQGMATPDQFGVPPAAMDPITGIPIAQPIDEQAAQQMMQTMPAGYVVAIDNKAISDIYQLGFDSYWRKCHGDEWIDQFTLTTLKAGFNFGLYGWDADLGHVLDNIPAPNSYPDAIKQFVWDWDTHEIYWILPLSSAQRKFPKYAKILDERAQRGQPKQVDSAQEQSYRYARDFKVPTVTLSITWMKDQPMPMSEQEAVNGGHVQQTATQIPTDGLGQADLSGQQWPAVVSEDSQGLRPQQEAPGDVDASSDTGDSIRAGVTSQGNDGPVGGLGPDRFQQQSGYQLPTGEPVDPTHPNWPMRLVLRQFIMIDEVLIEDDECPFPTIQAIHATCIPFEDTPYGFGLPWKMRHSQRADSVMADSIARNCEYLGNPAAWVATSIKQRMEDQLKTSFIDPGLTMGLEPDEMPNGKPLAGFIEFPPMQEHHIEGRQQMKADRQELGGYTDALKGTPVTPTASGELQKDTMQAASGIIASISKHLQGCYKHLAGNMLYSLVHFATAQQISYCCKKYKPEVIAAIHLTLAPQACWKTDVALASGAGQGKSQKRQDLLTLKAASPPTPGAPPLVDDETIQEAFNLDPQTIQQRNQRQMAQAMMMAPQQQPANGKSNGSNGKSNGNGSKNRMSGE